MDCTKVHLIDGGYVNVKITPEMPVRDILVNVLKKVSMETLQHDKLNLYVLHLHGDKKRTYLCMHRLWSEVVRTLNLDGSFSYHLELSIQLYPILYNPFVKENYSSFQYILKQIKKDYYDNFIVTNENKDKVLILGCLELRRYLENRDPLSKGALEYVEKKFGFSHFFPPNLIAQHKPKQFKKIVIEQLKKGGTHPIDEVDLKFLSTLKELKDFESTTLPCSLGAGFASVDADLIISPKDAIALRVENSSHLKKVGDFSDIVEIRVDSESRSVRMFFNGKEEEPIVLTFSTADEADFTAHLVDAYRLDGATQTDENTALVHGCAYYDGPDTDSLYGDGDYAAFEYGVLGGSGGAETLPYRELPRHQIVLERMLGEGQFGDVYRGVMREGSQEDIQVAIKTSKDGQDDAATQKFLEEAKTMARFDHPHIIRLIGVIKERPVWIVMELASLGELRPYLLEHADTLTCATLLMFCYQLSSALCYLEMKNIIHRDIAARNVLVSSADCVKLADFGLTRWLQENHAYTSTQGKLPLKWMAPESIHYRRFSSASDVWMFAVCMWEILQCGIKPFHGVKNNDAIQLIESGKRLEKPKRCPESIYRLLCQCWSYDAAKRPTFALIKPQLFDMMNEERKNKSQVFRLGRAPSVPGRSAALPPPPKPSTPNLNVSVEDIINQSMPSLLTTSNDGNGKTVFAINSETNSKFIKGFPQGSLSIAALTSDISGVAKPSLPPVPSSPQADRRQGDIDISQAAMITSTESPPVVRRFTGERSKSFENKGALKNALGSLKTPEIRKSQSLENVSTSQEKEETVEDKPDAVLGATAAVRTNITTVDDTTSMRSDHSIGEANLHLRGTGTSQNYPSANVINDCPDTAASSSGEIVSMETLYGCVINIVKAVHTLNSRVSVVSATECARLVGEIGYKLKLLSSTVDSMIKCGSISESRETDLSLARSVIASDFADLYDAFKLAHGASHIPRLYRDYCVDVLQKAHALAIDSKQVYEAACGRRSTQARN